VDKLFDGSPELLLTQLVSDRRLSPPEIRRLRKILDQRLKGGAR
jgi:predicted transcriptional regulator